MNIFSRSNDDEIVKVEEPESNPPSLVPTPEPESPEENKNENTGDENKKNENTNEEKNIIPYADEWFWNRWYKQRQDRLFEELVDRASKWNVSPFTLRQQENIESAYRNLKFAYWGMVAITGVAVLSRKR